MRVAAETSFEARINMAPLTFVQYGSTSLRTFIAITTSSSEALPARSPMPLTVHSIWRAPAFTPASEIGDRHAEIVVAVGGEARHVGIGHAVAQHVEQREIFLRHGVADRVGDIDGGRAGIDRGFHAAAEEIVLGAGAVLGRPFHVIGVAAARG